MFQTLVIGIRTLFSKNRHSREMDEELQAFFEDTVAAKMMRGQGEEEARRQAQLEMGSREGVKEEVRAVGWETSFENLWRDLVFSIRMLRKTPLFTCVAVLSLALGIGANTAIFTLIDNLLLKTLPVRDPAALVSFGKEVGGGQVDGIAPGPLDLFPYDFYQLIESPNSLLQGICAFASFQPKVSFRASQDPGQPARPAVSHLVSNNFFEVLGAVPVLGQTLATADAGNPAIAVVSYGFWRSNLAADPAVIGRTVLVNQTLFTIVGIMPSEFQGVSSTDGSPDLWMPLAMQPQVMLQPSILAPHGLFWLHFMGRLRPGVTPQRVQAWITPRLQQFMIARDGAAAGSTRRREIEGIFVEMLPARHGISNLRAFYSEPLELLMGVVVLVLLIACANLANYLLARATSRELELATRLALGSGSTRLIRQMLFEALLIACAGGLTGLAIAYPATQGLIRFIAGDADQPGVSPKPDGNVLAFTFGVSLLAGLLFGLAPALRIGRMSLSPASQASVRSTISAGGRYARFVPKFLIAFQLMLSLVLLVTTGLFVRTLQNLEQRDFGFDRKRVLLVQFNPKLAGYKEEQLRGLYARMLDGVSRLPGVRSASFSGAPPISGGNWDSPIYFKDTVPRTKDTSTLMNRVGPRYFETMGIPLRRGRSIQETDASRKETDPAHTLKVAVVNQKLADDLFSNGQAIGHIFTVADPSVTGEFQIVGVVANATYSSPREAPQRMTYLPALQLTGDNAFDYMLEIRTEGDPAKAAPQIQRALAKLEPSLPTQSRSIVDQTSRPMANEILISRVSEFFSILALALASIGLYGVTSYGMLRRSGEIGIRMTLGAKAASVIWMVLKESLLLLTIAIAIGVPITLAVVRLFQSQLFGLTFSDPSILLLAILILSAVVMLAAYLPARNAALVDPAITLRHQN